MGRSIVMMQQLLAFDGWSNTLVALLQSLRVFQQKCLFIVCLFGKNAFAFQVRIIEGKTYHIVIFLKVLHRKLF